MTQIKNIFLTGKIHVGKSTLINRVLRLFPGRISGFRTLPYYEDGMLNGFYLEAVPNDNTLGELHFVGRALDNKWVAFPDVFENQGVAVLTKSFAEKPDLLIMDELGFFEYDASRFQEKVFRILSSDIPVLGVLKQADVPFLNAVKVRGDVEVITVTEENRDDLFETLVKKVEEVVPSVRLDGKKSGLVWPGCCQD